MSLEEIKAAVDAGEQVFWSNRAYPVIKDNIGQYLITCTLSTMCIGLTWLDGVTLNGKEEDFFISQKPINVMVD